MAELKYIVYVDDDEDDREILQQSLRSFNEYKIETFQSGYDLFDKLKSCNSSDFPSLIVLDINMPDLNGIDLLELLKSEKDYSNIPVVMFSTGMTPYNKVKVQELNTDVIIKPVTMAGYSQVVKSLFSYCR